MLFGRFATKRSEARYPSLWDGLIAAWCPSVQSPNGLTLSDLSGNGCDGTLTNMDAATDWVYSEGRQALDFDGTNDYVSTPFSYRTAPGTMAFSCWFRTPSPATNFQMMMSIGDGSNQPELRFNSTTSKVHFVAYVGGNYIDQSFYSTSTTIAANTWYHVVGQYDGTSVQTWVNGVLDGSYAVSGAISNTNAALNLGSRIGSFVFNGQLDDLRVYNRSLAPHEIRLLSQRRGVAYAPTRRTAVRGYLPETGTPLLAARWKTLFGRFASRRADAKYPNLWDGLIAAWCPSVQSPNGTTLNDLSGNGVDGTLTNMDAPTDWVYSEGRQALDFDGVNDYIALALPNVSNAITISYWFKHNTLPASTAYPNRQHTICCGNSNGNQLNYSVIHASTQIHITFTSATSTYHQQTATYTPTTSWTHLIAILNWDNDTAACYINGVPQSISLSGMTQIPQLANGNSSIGRFPLAEYYSGQLDDCRIYNRALSESEILLLAQRRGIAYEPKSRPLVARGYTTVIGTRNKSLFGKYAANRSSAKYPQLWDGLIGAWCPSVQSPNGTTLNDLSGNGRSGTLTNMDAATDWVYSEGRQALDFDGTNDYVSVTSPWTSLSQHEALTVSAWVLPTAFSGVSPYISGIVGTYFTAYTGWTLRLNYQVNSSTNDRPAFVVNQVGTSTDYQAGSSVSIPISAWSHVLGYFDGTTIKIYVNGVETGSAAASGPAKVGTELRLGSDYAGRYHSGQIDDVRVYNRALTDSEIRLLAQRRGIAYDPRRRLMVGGVSTTRAAARANYRRRRLIIGANV